MKLDTSNVVDKEMKNIVEMILACKNSEDSIYDNLTSWIGGGTLLDGGTTDSCANLLSFTQFLPSTQCPLNVFVSGKYTGKTVDEVAANVEIAKKYAQAIMMRGHNVFCPHTMTAHWEDSAPDIMYGEYIEMCKGYIGEWADSIYMLPGSENSMGARIELEFAMDCGIIVYENITEVPFYWKRIVERHEE